MRFKIVTIASGAAIATILVLTAAWGAQPGSTAAQAATSTEPAAIPKIDPRADELLSKTCGALAAADSFSFHAEVSFDKVLSNTVKVQFAGEMNFYLQRPDELTVEYQSDLGGKRVWYQNGELTMFDLHHQMYASTKVPPSIDAMLDQVEQKQHITLPLANLAYSNPCQRIRKQIIYGGYIGENDVNGEDCDHVAFSSRNTDLQLWLARSGKPVPRKIVINYRTEPGVPEYTAVLSRWKFPKEIPSSDFAPQIPKEAKRIEFLKVRE